MREVVVVGAGPVGTLLAAELARRGVDVELLERRADAAAGTRAIGVHAPVLAALDASGITERLLAAATRVEIGEARSGGRAIGTIRFDRLSRRFPFVATLPQPETQRALAVGAPAPQHAEVTRIRLSEAGAAVTARRGDDPHDRRDARIVVVAGGPRARGLVFPAGAVRETRYPDRFVMADVAADGGGTAVVHLDAVGVLESFPLPGGRRRFVAPAPTDMPENPEAAGAVLRAALEYRGEQAAAASVPTASWFAIRRTVVPRMRRGPVFAIGDAAHEISPMGGQGMNLGLLDAVTLAPLLAEWVRRGEAPEADLARWERRRLNSARVAAGVATVNTVLGRRAPRWADAARRTALRGVLATPASLLFAHAYAMGFDADR